MVGGAAGRTEPLEGGTALQSMRKVFFTGPRQVNQNPYAQLGESFKSFSRGLPATKEFLTHFPKIGHSRKRLADNCVFAIGWRIPSHTSMVRIGGTAGCHRQGYRDQENTELHHHHSTTILTIHMMRLMRL